MLSEFCIIHYKFISSEYIAGDVGEKLDDLYALWIDLGS